MRRPRSFVRAVTEILLACSFVAFFSIPALGQSPSPTQTAVKLKPPGPPASYYASYGLIAIGALVVVLVLAGWLFQAPGFRRSGRGAASQGE